MGFMHHQRCEIDRRSVRVKLTDKGREIRCVVNDLFERHAEGLSGDERLGGDKLAALNSGLGRVERYWGDQIRYIY